MFVKGVTVPYKLEDIAYLAGLYEAEGSFCVIRFYWEKGEKHPRQTPQPKIKIKMTDVEPLERLQSVFGGNLQGPYKNGRDERRKPYYDWNLQSPPKVKELIELMWDWLSPRRRRQFGTYHTVHCCKDAWGCSTPGPEHIAYLAGLFEGDGTFYAKRFYKYKGEKRSRKTPQFQFRVYATDEEPLQRLRAMFGGSLYGPYKNGKNERCKPMYVWEIRSFPEAKEIIELVWPHLSTHRQKQTWVLRVFVNG